MSELAPNRNSQSAASEEESTLDASASPTHNSPSVESLLKEHHLTVFTLAMHLLNDRRIAQGVVEEVFLALSRKMPLPSDENALNALLHATTYDVALAQLVQIRRAKKAH